MTPKKTIRSARPGKNASLPGLATLYLGHSQHAIDSSNRIMLKSEWRGENMPRSFCVVLAPSRDYLVVCPPPVLEKFLTELYDGTAEKNKIPDWQRELSEGIRLVSLDSVGRLPLPAEFLAGAGIGKQGVLVGRFEEFEVWAPDKYEAARARRKETCSELLNKLQNL